MSLGMYSCSESSDPSLIIGDEVLCLGGSVGYLIGGRGRWMSFIYRSI